jgi:excisionase family DNA binding protein
MDITFENLPKAVTGLYERLDCLENLLLKLTPAQATPAQDELLTVQQTAQFLSLSVPTVYGLISKKELPVMKRGKRCYFTKAELLAYLKAGRTKTNAEIVTIATTHLSAKKAL